MLTIRFSRIGKPKNPFFRIIVSEKQRDTQGHHLELLGHYNPRTKETVLKTERITYWLGKGATTSNSVHNLLIANKVIVSDEKRRSVFISKKRKEKLMQRKSEGEPAAPASAEKAKAPAAPEEKTASTASENA